MENGDEKDKMKWLDDHLDAMTDYRGKVSEVIMICFVSTIMYFVNYF